MTPYRICSTLAVLAASLWLSGCVYFNCDASEVTIIRDGVFRCIHVSEVPSEPQKGPLALFSISPDGRVPVGTTVTFDARNSRDENGSHEMAKFEWDLDGDGSYETDTGQSRFASRTYNEAGTIPVRLRVTDAAGNRDEVENRLVVGSGMAQPVPPPRSVPPAGAPPAARTGGSAAARRPDRRFSARLRGVPFANHKGEPSTSGRTASLLDVVGVGDFRGSLKRRHPDRTLLKPFLRAFWLTELDFTTDTRTNASTARGIALATYEGATPAQSCVRLTLRLRRGKPPSGSLRTLGGAGAAATLDVSGKFTLSLDKSGTARVNGTMRGRTRAARAVPASCIRLVSIQP